MSIETTNTKQQIIEMPVTGLPGRTPRSAFEKPRTSPSRPKKEIRLILDLSGSNGEPASPDSGLTKAQVIKSALPHIVRTIAKYDSKAKDEQSGGSDRKGGVLTFVCAYEGEYQNFDQDEAEFDDLRFLGDLNESNMPEKMVQIEQLLAMGAMTFMTPPLNAAKLAYDTEIGLTPEAAETAIVDLIITDGKVSDPKVFENWLEDNAGPDHVIVVVVIGYDDGAKKAVEHYQEIADSNRYLTVVWLKGVVDGEEIGHDVELAAGLAA